MKATKVYAFLVIVLSVLFCIGPLSSSAAERTPFIKIGASSLGGTFFPLCAATAEVLNQNIKGTIFTATLGGGITNIKKIEAGTLYMGIVPGSSTFMAHKGMLPFKKKAEKVRTIGIYYTFPYNIVVRADSDINSIEDLRDKNIGVGKKGWSAEVMIRELLKLHGITYESIRDKGGKITMAGWSQMRGLFKDRKLDCIMDPSPYPSPGLTEISSLAPIRILNIPQGYIRKMQKINEGFYTVKVPAGAYRGHVKDAVSIGDPAVMVLSLNIPEALGYEITKGIFDNTKTIQKVHKALKNMSIENALAGVYLPLHPGSYRYYKERGIQIPANLKQ